MTSYTVTVVDFPAKHLIGMKTRSTMATAQKDCPALWEQFGPRIDELAVKGGGCMGAYGVSVMVDMESFEYWAAIEVGAKGFSAPGLERIDIEAGRYATCRVPNLDALGAALMHLYDEWPKTQSVYAPNFSAPGFEAYPRDWQLDDAFDIYMPVTAK